MGTKGKEIVSDIKNTLKLLNQAFADEWLAYYQYWIGAQIVEGPMRTSLIQELLEHAKDEHKHAQMLSDRITQLGGQLIIDPQDWYKFSTCKYKKPDNTYIKSIIQQNIEGEQCAITVYNDILKTIKDKDVITYHIIEKILEDELDHEQDLENMLLDLSFIK